MNVFSHFRSEIAALIERLSASGALPSGLDTARVTVEPPRDPAHGDLATNAAMVLAKPAGTNPRALAELIAPRLAALDEVEGAEIAGPGFINIRLDRTVWEEELRAVLVAGDGYGRSAMGAGSASMSAMSGDTTMHTPRLSSAGSWKHSDLPPPVGMIASRSWPPRMSRTISC